MTCRRLILLFLPVLLANAPRSFTPAPAYVDLFTPRGVPEGTYHAFVSPRPLDDLAAELGVSARPETAGDAFGQSGRYNRWNLARLYGGRRARVARLPRLEDGRVVGAWTLISPYPDPTLTRLEPGTLLLVLSLR